MAGRGRPRRFEDVTDKQGYDKERYKEDILLKNEDGTAMSYKESMKKKYGKVQLKLVLTEDLDAQLRQFCTDYNHKSPQEFIIGLIKERIGYKAQEDTAE